MVIVTPCHTYGASNVVTVLAKFQSINTNSELYEDLIVDLTEGPDILLCFLNSNLSQSVDFNLEISRLILMTSAQIC